MDKLLLTGPPGSGKSTALLKRFRGQADALLLVPTATMAVHFRHELARAGDAIRPSQIQTLSQFVATHARTPAATPADIAAAVSAALAELRLPAFEAVRDFPGFVEQAASAISELSSAGCSAARFATLARGPVPCSLAEVYLEVDRSLAARDVPPRHRQLAAAADALRQGAVVPRRIFLDGFFAFSQPELQVLLAAASHASLTVTLPDSADAAPALAAFRNAGFVEEACEPSRRAAEVAVFEARTMAEEVDEIARQILNEAGAGRLFREIGVVVRSRDPYVPALEAALERFGVPARSYFAEPLSRHAVWTYFSRIVESMVAGWDLDPLVSAMASPVSGVGGTAAGDVLEYRCREILPAQGIEKLFPLAGAGRAHRLLGQIAELDAWRRSPRVPRNWARELRKLRSLMAVPETLNDAGQRQAPLWRSRLAAASVFEALLDATADRLPEEDRLTLAEFWTKASAAAALEPVRVPDLRRNVVHLLDVYEARQWELPVVFVCGLIERNFPRYTAPDPLLPDSFRTELARAGVSLPVARERERSERFLFELARSRATHRTVLSYPRYDDKGAPQLRSFYLEEAGTPAPDRVRPRPERPRASPRPARIAEPALLASIADQHHTMSPSGVERFLQCPFQFFGASTLKLKPVPPAPRDRLDVLLQGSIVHRVLRELTERPLLGFDWFEVVFEEECRRAHVISGYRTEAVRIQMRRELERLMQDHSFPAGWSRRAEQPFVMAVDEKLAVRGRMDRLETGPGNHAVVIDYKYSKQSKKTVREHHDGTRVQAGLYLLAAEKTLGYQPAGVFYVGLRGEIEWHGWHIPLAGFENLGESVQPEVLREMMDEALRRTLETRDAVAWGEIAPRPADTAKCQWCDFADICRIEEAAAPRAEDAAP
ncbi:MAG: PD-(D/E)XK nuclease family protein [Bryobacteraceae bacterium]|nr:PD-(D/E)XK nuclease family protein [Bryobacteraceae bacterium]